MAEREVQQRAVKPAGQRAAQPVAQPVAGPRDEQLAALSTTLNAAPPVQRLAAIAPRNRTGLPDQLKAGVEAMSGMSLDAVRVHRNSSKPAQLNAHAYAQGTDIHLAPGQEQHLPHEAWHVVQQAQGRVRPTMQMMGAVPVNDDAGLEKEADVMGARAAGVVAQRGAIGGEAPATVAGRTTAGAGPVAQRILSFEVNPADYKIVNAQYFRTQGTKFMTGNKDYKHVTADTVKDRVYNDIDGITLSELARRVVDVAATYGNLPGLALLESHRDFVESIDSDEEGEADMPQTDAIGQNFAEFGRIQEQLSESANLVHEYKHKFDWAGGKMATDAAAFHLQNAITKTINLLEKFRDMMPLVNIVSGIQTGAHEREANAFLKTGKPSKNIKTENEALWAYFDFKAISEIADAPSDGRAEKIISSQLNDSLPWLDLAKARVAAGELFNLQPVAVPMTLIANYIAALMIANHIQLTTLSFPQQAVRSGFGTAENIRAMLDKADAPVDRGWVTTQARSRV